MNRLRPVHVCAGLALALACTFDATAQNKAVPTTVTAVKIRQGLLYGQGELGSLVNSPERVRFATRQATRQARQQATQQATGQAEQHAIQRYRRQRSNDTADPWVSLDKVQHATFGFLFTVGSQYTLVNKVDRSERASLPISVGVSAAVGLGKELYDWRIGQRRFFSRRDLIADGVGIVLAALLISI